MGVLERDLRRGVARATEREPSLDALDALDVAYARFNAARSLRLEDPALTVTDVGGLSVLRDPARPSDETYNRIVGLRGSRLGALDAALDALGGMPAQLDVAVDRMDPLVSCALRERGLGPAQAVSWLWAEPAQLAREPVDGVEVRRLGPDDRDLLLDLVGVSAATSFGPEIRARRAHHYCTRSFRAYLASVETQPAGWATLWVDGDAAIFGNAFVLAPFRRRGAHRALHAARARDAVKLGLSWVVADVLPESVSEKSALGAGMRRRTTYVWWRR
ncbi:MAG: hypothetical protein KF729_21135 [Sandaracinaceae bacterium]|nr:hypothetical protein [Sandaracinaceae bacterium]